MPNRKVLFLSLFIVIILFIGFFGLFYKNNLKEVKADALDNVLGFAWSSDIGWISFNNSSGGGGKNYGVNIDDNGATTEFSAFNIGDTVSVKYKTDASGKNVAQSIMIKG